MPQVWLVPMLLVEGDAIATVARCAALCLACSASIVLIDLPVAMPPWHLDMVWPIRRSRDAGLVWLMDALKAIAREAGGARTPP